MYNSDCESHPKSELSTMNGHAELTAVCSRTRKKSNVTINGVDQIACTVCIKIVGGQLLSVEYSAGLGSFTCININQYQHPAPDLNFPHPPPHPLSASTLLTHSHLILVPPIFLSLVPQVLDLCGLLAQSFVVQVPYSIQTPSL